MRTAEAPRAALASAFAAYLAFIAYQSLAGAAPGACVVPLVQQGSHLSRSDGLANLVAYVPLGLMAAAWAASLRARVWALAATLRADRRIFPGDGNAAGVSAGTRLVLVRLVDQFGRRPARIDGAAGRDAAAAAGADAAGARSGRRCAARVAGGAMRGRLDGAVAHAVALHARRTDSRQPLVPAASRRRGAARAVEVRATPARMDGDRRCVARAAGRCRDGAARGWRCSAAAAMLGQVVLDVPALSLEELAGMALALPASALVCSLVSGAWLARLPAALAMLSVLAYQLAPRRRVARAGCFVVAASGRLGGLLAALELALFFGWLGAMLTLSLRWSALRGEDMDAGASCGPRRRRAS